MMTERLRRVERLIREGCLADAREEVLNLLARKVARNVLADISRLARRVGLPEAGVRLLHPIVRPPGLAGEPVTDAERAEYAHCLIKSGAVDEGMSIVDAPEVLASGHMARWEYAAAIPILSRLIKKEDMRPYDRLVAQTNLAASLIHERRYLQADFLLRGLLHETSARRLRLLQGNALELSALLQWDKGRVDRAREFLDRAEILLARAPGLSGFFIRKWRAIFDDTALDDVREEARRLRHWETLRECDRLEGKLLEVYFGTPYASYRDKLDVEPKAKFDWNFMGGDRRRRLDLLAPDKILRSGGVPHRLLQALAHDMYRPARVATLFARLFPAETFNPETAPTRVHQALKHLRAALREAGFPLRPVERDGFYSLGASSPCTLVFHAEVSAPVDRRAWALRRLADTFGDGAFSFAEARACLAVSERTLFRVLEHGLRDGALSRRGRTTTTRYTITKRK